jgi:dsRNA-specific ribonuclease
MYTRNRSSQNFNNARNPPGPGQQANYNTKGGFQTSQPAAHQQANYKQGGAQQNMSGPKSQQQQQPPPPPQQQQQQQQPQLSTPTRSMPPVKQQVTQQLQQQGQQAQQQQMQQSPQQQQQQQQQPSTPAPQPQRLKPILKQTVIQTPPPSVGGAQQQAKPTAPQPNVSAPTPVAAPTSSNNLSDTMEDAEMSESMSTDTQEQPRWRRKTPGFKVNKKLKRLRMNQRLRKTLQPKNAIMVLNEMKAGCQFTFPETPGHMSNSLYLVHAELDGKTYVGQGLSKPLARQAAAENALKALLLEKMTAASMKARLDAESDGQTNTSVEPIKEENNEDTVMETNTAEDEIPWSSLASFALYKLFLEWHNQGTSVPVTRPGLPPVKGGGVKKENATSPRAPTQKELPPNPTSIHPVMLLNQMRPGLTYVEVSRVGNPPNTMFTLAVEVNGVNYSGTAKNKKDAKKAAAKAALLALYDLSYPEEASKQSMEID